jgi:hypothetical protein
VTILETIQSRGYWRVSIHPVDYREQRISYSELVPIIQQSSVELRGWDFPHLDVQGPALKQNYIEAEVSFMFINEYWRFTQSGNFIHYAGIFSDWRKEERQLSIPREASSDKALELHDTVARYVEIVEFASRLSRTPAGGETMRVQVELRGLKGRRIVNTAIGFRLHIGRKAELDVFTNEKLEFSQQDLTARPREIAAELAAELFARFGSDIKKHEIIAAQQVALRR